MIKIILNFVARKFHSIFAEESSCRSQIENSLQKHFENTPFYSFEIQCVDYPEILSVNNQIIPINFFYTSINRNDTETVKNLIAFLKGNPDRFLLEYNLKESELLTLYNKFNGSLLRVLGPIVYTPNSVIKYDNGNLSFSVKDIVI